MEQTFQHLFSLEFRHSFFKDGRFKPLQFSFETETRQLIKDLGIILKPYPGGIHFLALDAEVLNDPALNTPISLFIESNDPYYINYSTLDSYNPSLDLLYFNNLAPTQNSEDNALSLHSKKYVGQNDIYHLSTGKLKLDIFDQANSYQFGDAFGNDISDVIYIDEIGSEAFLISVQYKGIIHVFANGLEAAQVYANPKTVWKKPLAIVELYLPQLFEKFNQNEKQVYTLNFNARSTTWKYFLVSPISLNPQR